MRLGPVAISFAPYALICMVARDPYNDLVVSIGLLEDQSGFSFPSAVEQELYRSGRHLLPASRHGNYLVCPLPSAVRPFTSLAGLRNWFEP